MDSLQALFAGYPFSKEALASSLWLIIALPLFGALVSGVFGRWLGRGNTQLVACGAVLGSFFLSVFVLWAVNDPATSFATSFGPTPYALGWDYGTWFQAGDFRVNFGLMADRLSVSMLLVITGVGFLIHLYSTEYMSHDAGYWRYFAYLNLFVAMMLTLVLADSLVLLFVGWEGVGLCSYLLIGFWYTDPAKAWAGRKAFVTNRIGDFAFLIGMFLLVLVSEAFVKEAAPANFGGQPLAQARYAIGIEEQGPLTFKGLDDLAQGLSFNTRPTEGVSLSRPIATGPLAGYAYGHVVTAVLLLFLLGAAGKSAQLPLYVWLPDAMAGPTPVSALIHAATMVTAGVYLFCRVNFLVVLSPYAMAAIALVGGATALLAALIAFSQRDIKKVLAYSTVSQLGLMFLGVGLGAFWAAFLHVVTHAFFKACLFLGAGSVMHGNADETDIRKLGGLRREMPWTHATFLVATLAITGIVPLSGFFSKDAILHAAHVTELKGLSWVNDLAWLLGLATALCTAFYMVRVYWLTFQGERAKDAKVPHAHESHFPMVAPLVVLASLSVAALFYGIPFGGQWQGQTLMQNYLSPVLNASQAVNRRMAFLSGPDWPAAGAAEVAHGLPWGAWGIAWIIALIGGGAAYLAYTKIFPSWAGKPAPAFARAAKSLSENKFYVDELYERVVLAPIKGAAFLLFKVVDTLLIDTVAVRGTAWVTTRAGALLRYLQTGDVQSYAAVMGLALLTGLVYALVRVLS